MGPIKFPGVGEIIVALLIILAIGVGIGYLIA
jgi:hypothetical protein